MVVRSGIIPYAYDGDIPIRSHRVYPIGISGIFFEQAMWVMNAERRRYKGEAESQGDFEWNRYFLDGTTETFEPDPSGSVLGSVADPTVLTPINYIMDLRQAFYEHLLYDDIINDCDYTVEQMRRDFIFNAYPNSPSGFIESKEENGDGNYFRGEPPTTGDIMSTFLGTLGASGALFDIDIGEVMYQPYPRIGRAMYTSAHELRLNGTQVSTFPIVGSPIFPAFQDTQGRVVSTTPRDIVHFSKNPGIFVFGPSSDWLCDTEHVQSGVIRLDGDVLLQPGRFMIGNGGVNGREDFVEEAEFIFAASGFRKLGIDPNDPTGDQGKNSEIARVFLTPPGTVLDPVPCGVYYIAAELSPEANRHAVVSSGIISHWPSGTPNFIAPGYQVFDDCIWVTDIGGFGLTGGADPSGLSVISPYTGNSMWLRVADSQETSAGTSPGVLVDSWTAFYGVTRVGTDQIYRIRELRSVSGGGNGIFHLMMYDDNLNFVSESTMDSGVTEGQSHVDVEYSTGGIKYASSFWVGSRPGGTDSYWEIDAAFTGVQEYRPGLGTTANVGRIAYLPSIVAAGSSFFTFGINSGASDSDAIQGRIFSTTPSAGTGSAGTWVAGVNIPLEPDGYTDLVTDIVFIWDIAEFNGLTHVEDGVWVLFTGEKDGVNTVWLARVEYMSAFPAHLEIKALYRTHLKHFTSGVFFAGSLWYDITAMPIFSS